MARLNCYNIRASEGHWLAPDADFNLVRKKAADMDLSAAFF